MKCSKCGKNIADDSNFCEYCGSPVSNNRRRKTTWITLGLILVSFIGFAFLWMGIRSGGQTNVMEAEEAGDSTVAENDEFVDLGLPSGTLWKNVNEDGFYTYDEAIERYGNMLPTKAQLEELRTECQWMLTGSGLQLIGPSGNSINLPAAGYINSYGDTCNVGTYGHYWSSTDGPDQAYDMYFQLSETGTSSEVGTSCSNYGDRQSVRLVRN